MKVRHAECHAFLLCSLFGSLPEERVQDADSVWRQQQAHQQHSCTLDECFQFYTKEEQVPPGGVHSPDWKGAGCLLVGWPMAVGLTVLVAFFLAGPG